MPGLELAGRNGKLHEPGPFHLAILQALPPIWEDLQPYKWLPGLEGLQGEMASREVRIVQATMYSYGHNLPRDVQMQTNWLRVRAKKGIGVNVVHQHVDALAAFLFTLYDFIHTTSYTVQLTP